jgi:hypothetical protein
MISRVIRPAIIFALLASIASAQTLGDAARKARSEKPQSSTTTKKRVYAGEGSINQVDPNAPPPTSQATGSGATAVCGPISPEILEAITLRFGRDLNSDEEKSAEAAMLKWYDANRHLEKVDPSLIRSGSMLYNDRQVAKINQQADAIVKMAQEAIKEKREKEKDDKKFREFLLTAREKIENQSDPSSDEYQATVEQERQRRARNARGQGLSDSQARRMEAATNLLGICALQSSQAWGTQIQQRVREIMLPYIDEQLSDTKKP